MKTVLVRCWIIENYQMGRSSPDELFITYPEDNAGHDLITCLNCGEVYAVSVDQEVYIGPPLKEKVKNLSCDSCDKPLEGNYAYYPETYLKNGRMYSYQRPLEIPGEDSSIVKEFKGIYEN